MSGAIWWMVIGNGLLLAIASRWFTVRHAPKPCILCGRLARHRAPHSKTALCCEHSTAFAMLPRQRQPEQRTHQPRRHHLLHKLIHTERGLA